MRAAPLAGFSPPPSLANTIMSEDETHGSVQDDPVQEGASRPPYAHQDISSSIGTLGASLKGLEETDCLSQAALQSQCYTDWQIALESLNSSLHILEPTLAKLLLELHQRRAHIHSAINTVQNAKLPAMRLPLEIFSLIVEVLTHTWRPSPDSLGWMTTSHICSVWRRNALSLAPFWAKEIGVFRDTTSARTMLVRAQGAIVTVKNTWFSYREDNDTYRRYWFELFAIDSARIMNVGIADLVLKYNEVASLARILGDPSRVNLDPLTTLSVSVDRLIGDRPTADICTSMPLTPNLRWVSFKNVYVPFSTPNLVGLSIDMQERAPLDISCAQLFDILKSCQSLAALELLGWLPTDIPPLAPQKIRLPSLKKMNLHSVLPERYITLCRHLDMPVLASLIVDGFGHQLIYISSFLEWLFAQNPLPPCVQNVSRFGAAKMQPDWHGHSWQYHVWFDDGNPINLPAHSIYDTEAGLARLQASPQQSSGVRFNITDLRAGQEPEPLRTLFHDTVATWNSLASRLTMAPTLKSAYLDSEDRRIRWKPVLRVLTDVEVLYIPEFSSVMDPRSGRHDPDGGLMAVLTIGLSTPDEDERLPLPRLSTIVCQDVSVLVCGPESHQEDRDIQHTAISDISTMLQTRAQRNVPVTRMMAGSAYGVYEPADIDEEANEELADMVAAELNRVKDAQTL